MRILVFLLLFSTVLLEAQDSFPIATSKIPRWTLKTDLMPLINPWRQAVNMGTDVRIAKKFSIDVSAGYFFNAVNLYQHEQMDGLRIRAGLNYFFFQNVYLGIQAKYNEVNKCSYRKLLRQGAQYQEAKLVNRKKQSVGASFRIGSQGALGKKKRFLLGTSFGLGIVHNTIRIDLPPDAELLGRGDVFEPSPGKRWIPDLILAVEIGYCFW